MAERIALLNGRFSLHSQPGHGTRLEAEIPLGEFVVATSVASGPEKATEVATTNLSEEVAERP